MAEVQKYAIYDFILHSPTPHENPFRVNLTATLEHESGSKVERLPGFYNGNGDYIIRFSPTLEGQWFGHTASADELLSNVTLGPITCTPADSPTAHGIVTIDPNHPHRFAWQDGTPFVYLGFECDWLFAYHQSDASRCRDHVQLLADRGFNALVMNIYAHTGFSTPEAKFPGDLPTDSIFGPPTMYAFGGSNDAPDHAHLNVDFFKDYDQLMRLLKKHGIVAHLMLQVQNKHVNWPERRSPEDETYWRYVVARYQAFSNVIWDVGKESYNLLAETGSHDYTLSRIALIKQTDQYDHLVTVHDPEAASAGRVSEADRACDFVSDQIHLADVDRYSREALRKQQLSGKPYLNIEYGYELGVEPLKTYKSRTTASWQDVLKWTYALYTAGAYACYYYSNTSWDLIRFEPEPPGWQRYSILKGLLDDLPVNDMIPYNDLVDRGTCLADPGRAYLVYLQDGGDAVIDLTAIPCPRGPRGQLLATEESVTVRWTAIYTGEERDVEIDKWGWLTTIENPFEANDQPVVVTIRVN